MKRCPPAAPGRPGLAAGGAALLGLGGLLLLDRLQAIPSLATLADQLDKVPSSYTILPTHPSQLPHI